MSVPATESRREREEILVIGYGNELRGDDGVGRRLAEQVAAQGWEGVAALSTPQLTPDLAAEIAGRSLVVFADASNAIRDPAGVRVVSLAPSAGTARSHTCTPSALLALAAELYRSAPLAVMITISGERFTWNEELSQRARTNLAHALDTLERLLRARLQETVI